jgi:hypothetical protein
MAHPLHIAAIMTIALALATYHLRCFGLLGL